VWRAIASADGINSWFLPTDLDERQGGAIVAHMGDTDSEGTVTGWDPPRRFAYEEPDWAGLAGHEGAPVTPLATEFLVEAQSGGTCVVRVVSSAFGTGAEWESEFFEDMGTYWRPFFDLLRLYLDKFPGQRATTMAVDADVPGRPQDLMGAMGQSLGVSDVGHELDALGLTGRVVRMGDPYLLASITDPVPGYVSLLAMDKGDGVTTALMSGWLFGEDAAGYVERETPAWQDWLRGLHVPEASDAPTARR
jgi:uncharacterized protein YndB with AHSA1/START domain